MARMLTWKPLENFDVTRLLQLASVVLAFFLVAACGKRSPLVPSPPGAIAGMWRGEVTLRSFTGADCLAPLFDGDVVNFPVEFRAAIAQDGRNVTGTLDIDHTGGECTYGGTVDGDRLTLSAVTCTGGEVLGLTCPTGDKRDLFLQAADLDGFVAGDAITGTFGETDRVVASGTRTDVAVLIATSTFTMMRDATPVASARQ